MGGRKKKSIEELKMELANIIANSGQTEQDIQQDIHTDYKDYHTLKKGSILLVLFSRIMTFGG